MIVCVLLDITWLPLIGGVRNSLYIIILLFFLHVLGISEHKFSVITQSSGDIFVTSQLDK